MVSIFSNQATMLRRFRWPLPRASHVWAKKKRNHQNNRKTTEISMPAHKALRCSTVRSDSTCTSVPWVHEKSSKSFGRAGSHLDMIFSKTCEILTFAFLLRCKGTTPQCDFCAQNNSPDESYSKPYCNIFQCMPQLRPKPAGTFSSSRASTSAKSGRLLLSNPCSNLIWWVRLLASQWPQRCAFSCPRGQGRNIYRADFEVKLISLPTPSLETFNGGGILLAIGEDFLVSLVKTIL